MGREEKKTEKRKTLLLSPLTAVVRFFYKIEKNILEKDASSLALEIQKKNLFGKT